jgi:hypothetical protein
MAKMTGDMYQAHVVQGVEEGLDLRDQRLLAAIGASGELGEMLQAATELAAKLGQVNDRVKKWAFHHKPEPEAKAMLPERHLLPPSPLSFEGPPNSESQW